MDREVHERVGQYINVYHESTEHGYAVSNYDVFVMLHELEEPVTPEKVDEVSKIVQDFYEEHGEINYDLRGILDELFPTWGVEIRW